LCLPVRLPRVPTSTLFPYTTLFRSNWNGISPNYGKAFCCSRLALQACRQAGIQEVFATGWMDNGAETPIDAIYPGLAVFSFLCLDRKSTRLNSSHVSISYAVFCLQK